MKNSSCLFILAILSLCVCLSGCVNNKFILPAVQGEAITYKRTDPLGGTTIEATNVRVTERAVTADTASWNTVYPSFTFQLTVKGYKRERTPADPAPVKEDGK